MNSQIMVGAFTYIFTTREIGPYYKKGFNSDSPVQ